jgi:hypothetical protein
MRSLGTLVLGSTIIALVAAAPAAAQRYDVAAGYGIGAINFGAFNPGAGAADLALDPGWIVNLFGEGYAGGGHTGLRANVAFTKRPLAFAGDTRNISTWIADAGVVLRPIPLLETGTVSPFLALGGGVISYALGRTGRPVVIGEANVFYPGDAEQQWMATVGAGVDVLPPGARFAGNPLGIRLEVADHVALRSPFETLDGGRLGPIHNLRFGVSLVGLGWF